MGEFDSHDERIINQIEELLDKIGIENSVILISNPDNDHVLSLKRGEIYWAIGFMRTKLNQWESHWRNEDE